MILLTLLILTALAATVHADALVKAKLHTWQNPNLCLGFGEGTYIRDIVLRPCTDESTTWIIRDGQGPTFMRHRNYCLNGGFEHFDGGLDTTNGNAVYLQYCQFEANREGWDQFNGIMFPWRWDRLDANRFKLYGFALNPCLDVTDGRFVAEQKVQVWDCHDSSHPDAPNQKWRIEFLGPEYP